MVSMETDLFRGLGVARHWGKEGKHIVKSGSTSVVELDQLPLLGKIDGQRRFWSPPEERLPLSTGEDSPLGATFWPATDTSMI